MPRPPTDDDVYAALRRANIDTADHQTASNIAVILGGDGNPDDDLTASIQDSLTRLAATGRAYWVPAYGAHSAPVPPSGVTIRSLIREAVTTAPGIPEGPAMDAIIDHLADVIDDAVLIRSEIH